MKGKGEGREDRGKREGGMRRREEGAREESSEAADLKGRREGGERAHSPLSFQRNGV